MSREKLTYNPKENYVVFALASYLKDYRLSFFINQKLNLQLEKKEDVKVDNKKSTDVGKFGQYYYNDEENEQEFYLVQNKNDGFFLLKTLKLFDYLFVIKSYEENTVDEQQIQANLKDIENIQKTLKIDALNRVESITLRKVF